MITFTFTNSLGESIFIGNNGDCVLERIDGLSIAPVQNQGETAPYQDGYTYIDTLLNARELFYICQIRGNNQDTKRRKIIRVLNAKFGLGTLRIDFNGTIRTIDVVVDQLPNMLDGFNDRLPTMQRFTFSFVAPNPYYKGATEQFTLAGFVGGFSFPLSFPISFGEVGSSITINNDGDTIAPLLIMLNGPLENPTLTNATTGEVITVEQTIPSGYVLEINTEIGKKDIIIIDDDGVRSNGFQYVTPNSVLFGLAVGENVLTYTADTQPSETAVSVMFAKRYVGL